VKKKLKTICIIPARGGSKGIIKKNIRKLNGHPLIAYPIYSAIESKVCNKVFVSTDDLEIARYAIKYGADVPFLRSSKYAKDRTTTEETLKNALDEYENYYKIKFDICVFLTATDIFRKSEWIKIAVNTLKKNAKIESCFSVNKTHKNYWHYDKYKNPKRILNQMKKYISRQEKKLIYREDTGLACASRSFLWRKSKRIGNNVKMIINDFTETNIDIHTEYDLFLAKKTIEYFKKNHPDKVPYIKMKKK